MFCRSSWHLLFTTIVSALLITQTHCDDRKTYIVYMGDHTEVAEADHMSMVKYILGRNFEPRTLLHSYKKSFNGFVVRLTEEEAERMAEMDDVISVFLSEKHTFQTTRSWDFIGFPQQVKRSRLESDVIVGVIDYGIWPESESFNDQGFGPPPKKWKGSCQNFTCTNKIVGAKYFGVEGSFDDDDIKSPRDSRGHGTHCASVAAGNLVSDVSLYGLGSGTARGGVPSARIAVYKPCWSSGCADHDILAAFDEAISDGVDIISLSIGSRRVVQPKFFEDTFAIGPFHAMKKGILTSTSANNLGPDLFTLTSYAPWSLSVAATTIDRKFFTKVQLGNGMVYEGISVNTFNLENKSYPLVYAGSAPNITGGFNSSLSSLCVENSLDEALVKGKIVVCDAFAGKGVGLASGAAGVVFRTTFPKDNAYIIPVPAATLSRQDGTRIISYINSSSSPTANIFKSNEGRDSLSPYVASFSSRGPNPITPDILKPDIAAPGVDIIAAWSPLNPVSEFKGDERVSKYFNIQSGTSMACPHATAAAAYIKSFHPTWSPAAIKSALMTTATPLGPALNPEAEFAYGAGQIDPMKAVKPGLVYDISELDYVRFLCGEGYSAKKLRIITDDDSSCTKTPNQASWDLNLPSFALHQNKSTYFTSAFHRTVTNVGEATSVYKAKVIAPPSLLNIEVKPDLLSFSSFEQNKSFTLTIEGSINVEIVSASLIWDDGNFQVRSPIVVYSTKHHTR